MDKAVDQTLEISSLLYSYHAAQDRIAELEASLKTHSQSGETMRKLDPEKLRETLLITNYNSALHRIADLEAQLKAYQWQPITAENLPKDGDEVGGFGSFPFSLDIVTYAVIKDYQCWKERCMTHFRSLNPPK
jgi:hypothetical protein